MRISGVGIDKISDCIMGMVVSRSLQWIYAASVRLSRVQETASVMSELMARRLRHLDGPCKCTFLRISRLTYLHLVVRLCHFQYQWGCVILQPQIICPSLASTFERFGNFQSQLQVLSSPCTFLWLLTNTFSPVLRNLANFVNHIPFFEDSLRFRFLWHSISSI